MDDRAGELAIVLAVYERIAADRESGIVRTLAEYQRDFPGREALVAGAWARAESGSESTPPLSETWPAPPAPRRLGHYRLERELGRGAQGTVWLAIDERLGRPAAVKVLAAAWAASPDALRRFDQEARALAALDHPNLCAIHEAFTHDGTPCLAVRYVPGETLAAVIAARGGRAPDRAGVLAGAALVETVARAVHAAHAAGVIHRDLKPGNIMVAPDGTPVVLDFGLARRDSNAATLTATGDILGTPAYMAPEQAAGDARAAGPWTDVHALGAILFELATGTRPWSGATWSELLDAVRRDAPPDPRRRNRHVPRDLAVVVRTALAKAPADRYLTALDLAEDLRRARSSEPIVARPPSAAGRLARWARRRPVSAALALTLAIAVPALSFLGAWSIINGPRVAAQQRAETEARAERLIERGFAAIGNRRPKQAFGFFGEAEKLIPGSREVLAGKVLALSKGGRAADALGLLESPPAGTKAAGGDSGLAALRRLVLKQLDRPPEPTPEEADPGPADDIACYIEGQARLAAAESGEPEEFERAYVLAEAAVQRAPSRRLLYFDFLAHAVGRTDRAAEARRAAESLRLVVGGAKGELLAGIALVGSDAAASADAFARARALGADVVDTGYGLGAILNEQGKFPEAARIFRELTALRPDDATLHLNLSIMETRAGNYDPALAAAEQACALRPDLGEFHAHVGYLLRDKLGRHPEAIVPFGRAAAAEPANARWQAEHAITQAACGDAREGLEAAGRALALDGKLPLAWRARSLAQSRLGDHAEALASIVRAGELAPDDAGLRMEHVRRLVACGQVERARRVYDAWIDRARETSLPHATESALAELTAAESAR